MSTSASSSIYHFFLRRWAWSAERPRPVGIWGWRHRPASVPEVAEGGESGTHPADGFLRHGIDILRFTPTNRTIFISGWAYNARAPIVNLHVIVHTPTQIRRVSCRYGFPRTDVEAYFGEVAARSSGFSARFELEEATISKLYLEIDYVDGASTRIRIRQIPPLSRPASQGIDRLLELAPALDREGLAAAAFAGNAREAQLAATEIRFLQTLGADATPYVVMFDHNVGGGANFYSAEQAQRFLDAGRHVLRVYYDLSEAAFRVERIDGGARTSVLLSALDSLLSLAELVRVEAVFMNNLYTFEDPLYAIRTMLRLKRRAGARLTVTLHDYYGVCPEFNLLDVNRRFCGVPDAQSCRNCLCDNRSDVLRDVIVEDIELWRASWARLFREADEILGFSAASLRILRKAYPELDSAKIVLRPHAVEYLPAARPRITQTRQLHIGIIGTINENKGSALVAEMAEQIARFNLPARITVIGELGVPEATLERLRPALRCTGRYDRARLPELIEEEGINLCFFPSMWPETFSYVTSEIMGLGVPLAVYGVGAPPERVAMYDKGKILEGIGDAARTVEELMAFHQTLYPAAADEASASVASVDGRVYAFTSANVHYLPKARLLCRSIKEHHPEFRFVLVLVDGRPDWFNPQTEPFDEIVLAEDLAIEDRDSWIFRHDVVELCTAVKPFAAAHLLERRDCAKVLYFDPDMVLFSRLDDLLADLSAANLCLTPHQTNPEGTIEHIIDNEICSLKHGVYNLGFIGLSNTPEARRFAKWWADRLYHFCRADIPNGLFTDQKWIDLVPSFFQGVAILKSPRFNVATWNLTTRKLTGGPAAGYLVDGQPLGFYHFTGFDSGAHALMAQKNVPGNLALMNLLLWYKEQLAQTANGLETTWRWPYGFYANGEKILPGHRALYRSRVDLQQAFPHPRETAGENNYYQWLHHEGMLDADAEPLAPKPAALLADPYSTPPTFTQVAYDIKRLLWHRIFPPALRRGLNVLRGRQ